MAGHAAAPADGERHSAQRRPERRPVAPVEVAALSWECAARRRRRGPLGVPAVAGAGDDQGIGEVRFAGPRVGRGAVHAEQRRDVVDGEEGRAGRPGGPWGLSCGGGGQAVPDRAGASPWGRDVVLRSDVPYVNAMSTADPRPARGAGQRDVCSRLLSERSQVRLLPGAPVTLASLVRAVVYALGRPSGAATGFPLHRSTDCNSGHSPHGPWVANGRASYPETSYDPSVPSAAAVSTAIVGIVKSRSSWPLLFWPTDRTS